MPEPSMVKEPSLVKKFWEPLLTTKKESPVIIISKGLLVVCAEPWVVIDVEIAPVLEPRPIWRALVPPRPVVELAPVAYWVVWYNKSLNTMDCDL